MRKRILVTTLVVVVAGSASLFVPLAESGASPAVPGFHAAVLMPTSSGGTEPSLAISNSGVRYVSWQSPGMFAGSADGVNFGALGTPEREPPAT